MAKKKAKQNHPQENTRGKRSSGSARGEVASPPRPEDVLQPVPPRKQTKGGRVRLTNHKSRSRWFQTRASWPVREASVNRLVRERMRVEKALAAPPNLTSSWECVGPTNIGGRITSLAYHRASGTPLGGGGPEAACGTSAMPGKDGIVLERSGYSEYWFAGRRSTRPPTRFIVAPAKPIFLLIPIRAWTL